METLFCRPLAVNVAGALKGPPVQPSRQTRGLQGCSGLERIAQGCSRSAEGFVGLWRAVEGCTTALYSPSVALCNRLQHLYSDLQPEACRGLRRANAELQRSWARFQTTCVGCRGFEGVTDPVRTIAETHCVAHVEH